MRYRTLDKNWQFNRVYGRGKSYVHPHCVLYVAKNRLGYTRIGLTATKKVGHAVQRNRAGQNPFAGNFRKVFPHPSVVGATDTFPKGKAFLHIYYNESRLL